MSDSNASPQYIPVGRFASSVVPFLHSHDKVPDLNKNALIGRIVYIDDQCIKGGPTSHQIWICENKNYGINDVHQKNRSIIRRAINLNALIEKISWAELNLFLPDIVNDTFSRQNRVEVKKFLNQISRLECTDRNCWNNSIEIFVSKLNGCIGAVAICLRSNGVLYILHQASYSNQLYWGANHYLTFELVNYAFKNNMSSVNYGLRGYDVNRLNGLDVYKERMGFRRKDVAVFYECSIVYYYPIKFISSLVEVILYFFPKFKNNRIFSIFQIIGSSNLMLSRSKYFNKRNY